MDRQGRARVVVAEAQALGPSVQDLVAASAGVAGGGVGGDDGVGVPAACRADVLEGRTAHLSPYWWLAERHFGDRCLDTVTVDDCEAVVLAAVFRSSPQRNCRSSRRAGASMAAGCGDACRLGPGRHHDNLVQLWPQCVICQNRERQ